MEFSKLYFEGTSVVFENSAHLNFHNILFEQEAKEINEIPENTALSLFILTGDFSKLELKDIHFFNFKKNQISWKS